MTVDERRARDRERAKKRYHSMTREQKDAENAKRRAKYALLTIEQRRKRGRHEYDPEKDRAYQREQKRKRRLDPAFRAREREAKKRWFANLTPEQRAKEQQRKNESKRRLRATRERQVVVRDTRVAVARSRASVEPVPSFIRDTWNKAHENSMIRRKYPTVAALTTAYHAGELRMTPA